MARIKGTNLSHVRDFVERELGTEAVERMRLALAPEDRKAYDAFVAVAWYPERLYVQLLRALKDVGAGDDKILARAGGYAAEYDLTKIHRVLFRFANPAFVLEKSMDIWDRFFDSGTWKITRHGDKSADGLLEGWGVVDAAACEYLRAYLARMFELVGATNVHVGHPECRTKQARACRFIVTWD
jgi:hypothetical protein